MTVAEAADGFLRDCDRRHHVGDAMSASSLAHYATSVKLIKARFGAVLVKNLTTALAQDWVDEMTLMYKRRTIETRYSCLRLVLLFSVRKGWIKRSVLKDETVRLPTLSADKMRIPSKGEIVAIIDSTRRDRGKHGRPNTILVHRVMVLLGFHAGLRIGEIAGLQWENVDFANGLLYIRHSHSKVEGLKAPKTAAGNRDVPMSSAVREALQDMWNYWTLRERAVRLDNGGAGNVESRDSRFHKRLAKYLKEEFEPHGSDQPLSGFVLRAIGAFGAIGFDNYKPMGVHNLAAFTWPTIMKDAGMTGADGKALFSSHKMRHAAVSLLVEAGLPVLNLKTVIGHSDIRTTMGTYAHLFPDDQRARNAINDITITLDATRAQQIALTNCNA